MFENVLVQVLQPGYMLRQPPLYEWLLWSVQHVAGPTIWSFLFLKYALISLAALFLFLSARKAIPDPRIAALCVFCYSLFYQFGWNLHEGVTHTLVMVTACAASAFYFLLALETRRLSYYAALGLAAGAGLLGKHSFALFVPALLLAAALDPVWRSRFRLSGLGLALLVAAAVYSPYLIWILTDGMALVAEVSRTMGVTEQSPHVLRAGEGLAKLAFSLLGFSVPLVPVLLLVFWQRYLGRADPLHPDVNPAARLAGRTVLTMIGLTALLIAWTGATYVKERHMHPLLLLAPIWLFADLARFEWDRRWRRLAMVAGAVALVAFIARVPGLVMPDRFWCGGKCRHMKPYADLQQPLSELWADKAVLVAGDDYTGGNLRVLFPSAVIISPSAAGSSHSFERCFYIWEDGETEPALPALEAASERLGSSEGRTGIETAAYLTGNWPHLFKEPGWRTTWWGVAELVLGNGLCRPPAQGR